MSAAKMIVEGMKADLEEKIGAAVMRTLLDLSLPELIILGMTINAEMVRRCVGVYIVNESIHKAAKDAVAAGEAAAANAAAEAAETEDGEDESE